MAGLAVAAREAPAGEEEVLKSYVIAALQREVELITYYAFSEMTTE